MSGPPGSGGGMPRVGGLPISAIIVIALAVAILVWLLFIRGGDDDDSSDGNQGIVGPAIEKTVTLVPAAQVPAEVQDVDNPVYWVGSESGTNYEVTVIEDGRTYVRYLPDGVEAESTDPYLTVGSYEQKNAFDVLEQLGKKDDADTFNVPNGGKAVTRESAPDSVYVAYPGIDTQIEVYDPEDGRALELVRAGDLSPVG